MITLINMIFYIFNIILHLFTTLYCILIRIYLLTIGLLFLSSSYSFAYQANNYHVIVGAFRNYDNAIRFKNSHRALNVDMAFHKERNLYYMSTLKTDNKYDAYFKLKKVRSIGIPDAWVYKGKLTDSNSKIESNQKVKDTVVVTIEKSILQFKFENPVKYGVCVQAFDAQSKEKLDGLLDVYDSTKSKLIGHIETFKNYGLALFGEYKGNVIFNLDFLGFNPLERKVNFNRLLAKSSNDLISINGDTIYIALYLEPEIKLNSFQTLDQIYFYLRMG